MITTEFVQGLLLSLLSIYDGEHNVYRVACHLTQVVYPEYADVVCLKPIPNEEIRREIQTFVYYPDASPPFPGILLLSGSSPATSDTMMERKEFFLKRGFAVMVLDSFTPSRVLEDCFRKNVPCKTYQQLSNHYWNSSMPLPRDCPFESRQTAQKSDSTMLQAYLNRVTTGSTLSPAERAHDLYEALHIFRRDEKVDSDNLAIVGYSHGGSTVLEALTLNKNEIPPPGDNEFSPEEHSLKGVRAAIVYYPNCRPGMYFHWHAAIENIDFQIHLARFDEYVRPDLCYHTLCRIDRNSGFRRLEMHYYNDKHAFDMKEYGSAYNSASKNLAYERSYNFIFKALDSKYQYKYVAD